MLATSLIPCLLATAMAARQPNLLLVVLDDIGNDLIGVYGEGPADEQPPTPSLDGLARQGIVFTHAYTNPTCSPTRASLMTGLYASRTGIGGAITTGNPTRLSFKHRTLPEMLSEGKSGYVTALLGKWHLGEAYEMFDPVLHGFDVFLGTRGNVGDHFSYTLHLASRTGLLTSFEAQTYTATRTTDDAIEAVHVLPEPWLVWVNYHLIHKPLHVPPAHLHNQPFPLQRPIDQIMAMTEAMDTEFGRLLSVVDLTETVVVVLGDNGGKAGITSNTPTGKGKASMFEGGVNVPFLVAGPAIPSKQQGKTCSALVNTTDLYATVAELAGVDLGEMQFDPALDSNSIVPLLEDPAGAHTRDFTYAESFKPNSGPPYPDKYLRMIRGARYKYVRNVRDRSLDRFYDLDQANPGLDGPNLCPCPDNLSPEQWTALRALEAMMDQQVGADLPGQ